MTGFTTSSHWKNIFIGLSLLSLVVMPLLSKDFGQNGDENVEIQYGIDIFNYYAHGDPQAIDYDSRPHPEFGAHIQGMQFYGGMFDLLTESVHRAFPSWHIVDVRHFFSALFGAWLFIFTGLLAYRLSHKKWWVAVLSLLFILFSPRLFGESMNNGKDIPFAMGMTMGTYYLLRLLQDLPHKKNLWGEALLFGLGWAIVFGTRAAGGILFLAYTAVFIGAFYVLNPQNRRELKASSGKLLKKFLLYVLTALAGGYLLGLLTWPFGMQSPLQNLMAAFNEMANREVNIRVLFEGRYYSSLEMPWYYEFKWIFITSPLIILLLCCMFIPLLPKALKVYGRFTVFLLLFSALFPILYIIYKNSTVYDTWRHVFFVYPFWVIMAALSIDLLSGFLKDKLKWIPVAAAGLGLLPAMVWTVRSHPHQYVYFNAFTGGPSGAFGQYDLDYYLISGKASAEWILDNVPRPPKGEKIKVLTNMEGMDTYFRNDTSWIYSRYARYYERNQHDWDYYITYGRFVSVWQLQNGKWPPAHVVHAVEADGVPIGVVLKRSSKASYRAYEALQKNDFAQAAALYEQYLKTDSTDESVYINYAIALASAGRLPEAVQAVEQASRLDASRADFYQILAQIYQGMGEQEKARQAMMRAQSMMAQAQLAP